MAILDLFCSWQALYTSLVVKAMLLEILLENLEKHVSYAVLLPYIPLVSWLLLAPLLTAACRLSCAQVCRFVPAFLSVPLVPPHTKT